MEGELMKYKPQMENNHICRWGQLTKDVFMYFKNQYSASCWLNKPIIVIPIRFIERVIK